VLWLGDGPGYSALVSAFLENGPFLFKASSSETRNNTYAWNLRQGIILMLGILKLICYIWKVHVELDLLNVRNNH